MKTVVFVISSRFVLFFFFIGLPINTRKIPQKCWVLLTNSYLVQNYFVFEMQPIRYNSVQIVKCHMSSVALCVSLCDCMSRCDSLGACHSMNPIVCTFFMCFFPFWFDSMLNFKNDKSTSFFSFCFRTNTRSRLL